MQNPLFPTNQDEPNVHNPVNPAADLIRHKLNAIYAAEPSAKQELQEVKAEHGPLSEHQAFIKKLHASGQPLAHIQTAWHNYYLGLSDEQKHEVWREFYETHAAHTAKPRVENTSASHTHAGQLSTDSGIFVAEHQPPLPLTKPSRAESVADIRRRITRHVTAGNKLKPKHHLQSLLFGLGMGTLVIFIFLFGFFNEVIIAPFIQPSRHVSSTPLIVASDSIAATATPEVIIPKINVEIPVDYSQTSTNESVIEGALNNGVVHYPSTVTPGQQGNAAFFGHSSNNIFNPGKYKFAFVLLHDLVPGDTFYLTYNGTVYAYQVFDKKIVPPAEVGVLNNIPGKTATATLITCDPPGTSINRLVVVGEQISPSTTGNTAPAAPPQAAIQPVALPGNGPTLWTRFWHWLF